MDRAGDEILAGAALAGNQHRQVAALQALNLFGHALHGGAGADESREQRLEGPFDGARRGLRPGVRAPSTGRIPGAGRRRASGIAEAPVPRRGVPTTRPPACAPATSRPMASTISSGVADPPSDRPARDRHRPGDVGVAARRRNHVDFARPRLRENDRRLAVARLEERGGSLLGQQRRRHGRVDDALDQRRVALDRRPEKRSAAGASGGPQGPPASRSSPAPRRAIRRWRAHRPDSGWRGTARPRAPASLPSSR